MATGTEVLNAGCRDHVVLFYRDEQELTERVSEYLLPAVQDGGMAIVVATPDHRRSFETHLAATGIDVAAVLAVAVPTAFSDLSAAVAQAVVSKPLAVAFLDRAESVRRLKRRPVALPPGPHADTGAAGDPPAVSPAEPRAPFLCRLL